MQQHLGRLDGVAKVDVNLADGKVVILAKEDSRLDPALVLKATFDSGVTVQEMIVTASGEIAADTGGIVFRPNPAQSYVLTPNRLADALKPLAGATTRVTLRGRIYQRSSGKEKKKPNEPLRLEVLEILKKG